MYHNKGFTLLEILIAIFIFSIVAMIMTRGLQTIFNTSTRIEKNTQRFAELDLAMTLVANDIDQLIDRPVNVGDQVENAVVGTEDQLAFTHTGWSNPNSEATRSTLQRTVYLRENNRWIRVMYPVLDRTQYTTSSKRILLSDVQELSFNYLNKEGQLLNSWKEKTLPLAIKITVSTKDLGQISQLYPIEGHTFAP